jgi:hypothetical protein
VVGTEATSTSSGADPSLTIRSYSIELSQLISEQPDPLHGTRLSEPVTGGRGMG